MSRAGAIAAREERRRAPEPREHPPGLIGVLCQETARYSHFAHSLTGTAIPAGSAREFMIGIDVAQGSNRLCELLLASPSLQWLWILGDDHAWFPSLLVDLLGREVDVAIPLCLTKSPPFEPLLYTDWLNVEETLRQRIRLDDHPEGGLVPVHSGGSAGMLIRRDVIEAIEPPWFEMIPKGGQWLAEDLYFCDKAREAGFGIYGDLDNWIAHIGCTMVTPARMPDGWTFGFRWPDGFKIMMPVGTWVDE